MRSRSKPAAPRKGKTASAMKAREGLCTLLKKGAVKIIFPYQNNKQYFRLGLLTLLDCHSRRSMRLNFGVSQVKRSPECRVF
jgi:hypothetical protein